MSRKFRFCKLTPGCNNIEGCLIEVEDWKAVGDGAMTVGKGVPKKGQRQKREACNQLVLLCVLK